MERIWEHALMVHPDIKREQITTTYAGLRPYRVSGVRVDATDIGNKRLVNNVGHGGSGWTFCWGTAEKSHKSCK